MGFKEFYLLENKYRGTFQKIFDKYYDRGFFGSLLLEKVLPHQSEWYNDFISLIKEKNEEELILILSSKEHKLSREYFTEITGVNVKYQTKEKVTALVKKYIADAKADMRNV